MPVNLILRDERCPIEAEVHVLTLRCSEVGREC